MKTLNEKLGKTFHHSLLRRKLIRLGLPQVRDWETLAIQRGCSHYQNNSCTVDDPGEQLSNEELGLALLLGEDPYKPRNIRISNVNCREGEAVTPLESSRFGSSSI